MSHSLLLLFAGEPTRKERCTHFGFYERLCGPPQRGMWHWAYTIKSSTMLQLRIALLVGFSLFFIVGTVVVVILQRRATRRRKAREREEDEILAELRERDRVRKEEREREEGECAETEVMVETCNVGIGSGEDERV